MVRVQRCEGSFFSRRIEVRVIVRVAISIKISRYDITCTSCGSPRRVMKDQATRGVLRGGYARWGDKQVANAQLW